MAQSIRKDFNGPIWPLGLIVVATPGTPVSIMSLVDPTSANDPNTLSSRITPAQEYTVRAQQIIFQGYKASGGLAGNSGNIYILRRGGNGSNNRTDYGTMALVVATGQTIVLASAPLNRNVFSPYDYFVDADNASDGCLVTLVVQ
jgi:hypothetical protein